MTKPMFHITVAIVACLVLAAASVEAKGLKTKGTPSPKRTEALGGKDRVTLEIAGPTDSQAAAAFQKAFEANGLQAKVQESKKGGKPLRIMTQIDKTADLSPWAKAVAWAVPTKKGQTPPAVELVVFAQLTKENSSQAMAQLEKLKGVDAKHSTADVKKGALRVRISGSDKVTAEEISNALEAGGVKGQVAKVGKTPKTKKTT